MPVFARIRAAVVHPCGVVAQRRLPAAHCSGGVVASQPDLVSHGGQRTAHLDSSSVLVVSDSAVAVSGFDTLTDVHDGKSVASHGRVTFVVAKRGGDWKIVQFHRSPMPK